MAGRSGKSKGKPLTRKRKAAIAEAEVKPPPGTVRKTADAVRVNYSRELGIAICERIARGESVRSICRTAGMPSESAVRLWAVTDVDGFKARYDAAREAQMDALAEDLIEIGDDKSGDVNRDRLRSDNRKWVMARIAPKRWGDRVTKELVGDGGGPVRVDVTGMSDAKLAQLEELLSDVAGASDRPSQEGEGGEGTS